MKRLALLLCVTLGLQSFGSGFFGGGGGGGSWGGITGTLSDQTDLQTALDARVADTGNETIAGIKTFSSAPVISALTASTVPYLDAGKALASSAVTPTELGYVSGVSSAIQTQLGTKAPTASPTFTGTVTLPNGVTIDSSNMTFANNKTVTYGNSTFGNESGNSDRLEARVPNGGRLTGVANNQQMYTFLQDSFNFCAFANSLDCTVQWGMGKGTSHYGKGVALGYSSNTAVGNVGAGEDDLQSKTVQANALSSDGDRLEVSFWGVVGTGGTKTIKIYEDATLLHTITTTQDSKAWNVECDYSRTGASAGNYFCKSVIGTVTDTSSGTLSDTHTTTMVWKATGESGDSTTDDVIGQMVSVKHMKVGN